MADKKTENDVQSVQGAPGLGHRVSVALNSGSRMFFVGLPTLFAEGVDLGSSLVSNVPRLWGGQPIVDQPLQYADRVRETAQAIYDAGNDLTGHTPPPILDSTDEVVSDVSKFAVSMVGGGLLLKGAKATGAAKKPASTTQTQPPRSGSPPRDWAGSTFSARADEWFREHNLGAVSKLMRTVRGVNTAVGATAKLGLGALVIDNVTGNRISHAMGEHLNETADAFMKIDPDFAESIRNAGPKIASMTLEIIAMPFKSANGLIAGVMGRDPDDPLVRAFSYAQQGQGLLALFAAQNLEIDGQEAIRVLDEAKDKEDPSAYIHQNMTVLLRKSNPDKDVPDNFLEGVFGQETGQGLSHQFDAARTGLTELAKIQSLQGEGLTNEFNRVVEKKGLNLFSSFNMFFATITRMIGLESLSSKFQKAVLLDDAISQFGAFDDVLHSRPALRAGSPNPAPAPAPAPA